MRISAAAPIALVLILVATGLFVAVAPARAGSVAAPAKASHPLATDTVLAVDRFGGVRTSFSTGYSAGVVYFTAHDPSDTSATVAIWDKNATRDHVNSPVVSWTASFSASAFNYSYLWSSGFLLPLTLTYEGWWNITISGTGGGFSSTPFFVHTYSASLTTTVPGYLPGHSGTGVYVVQSTANGAPYRAAAVTILATYSTAALTQAKLPGSPFTFAAASMGTFNFTVPTAASTAGQVSFYLYANVSGAANSSESGFTSAQVGNLSAPLIRLGTCPSGCYTSAFQDGTPVYVTVQEWIVGVFTTTPASGAKLAFQYNAASKPVTPSNVPLNMTTNGTGGAQVLFIASSAVFGSKVTDEIIVTATDPANPSLAGPFKSNVFFSVLPVTPGNAQLQVSFDSLQYYGGDTATVNWQVGGLNASQTTGWTVSQWLAYETTGSNLIAWGTINSTATSGKFSFPVPLGYGGTIFVDVNAYNASSQLASGASALVTAPTILLNPSEPYYLPGDTVTVQVTTQGSVFGSTTLYQSVIENSGTRLASGTLSGSQIQFTVPKTGTPSSISVSVAAESATLGVVSSASISLSQGSGYVLFAGVSSKSNYVDGSYQPGQTVTIAYSLQTVGNAILPKTFQIYIYPGSAFFFGSSYGSVFTQSTTASGSASYTLPSNMPAGQQTFTVVVTSGACGFSCGAATQFSVNIEPNPSPLSYQLGAGSGVTVGWVILLVLILVVALLGFWWMRRAGRGGGSKPISPYSSGSSSGDRPSESVSGRYSQDSGSSSGSQPPMPGSPPS